VKKVIICGGVIALCLACGSDEEGDGAVLILSGAGGPDCGPGNVLVFVRDGDLYWCDEEGRNVTRITYTPYDWEENPAWSPDGEYIAYAGDYRESKKSGIFVIPRSGGEPVQLTTNRGKYPDWSPDGMTIAYNDRENYDIWTVPASGGEPRRLTTRGYCSEPCWSPDGERIYFAGPYRKNPLGPCSLWYVNSEGGDVAHVWASEEPFYYLALSPGGEWLAAVVDFGPSPYDIWLFNVKSGEKHRLTREPGYESDDHEPRLGAGSPTWAENRSRVYFGSDRYNVPGIYEIRVNR
jgi:Tol biopolymer transport system component